jgi:hypothetical protein
MPHSTDRILGPFVPGATLGPDSVADCTLAAWRAVTECFRAAGILAPLIALTILATILDDVAQIPLADRLASDSPAFSPLLVGLLDVLRAVYRTPLLLATCGLILDGRAPTFLALLRPARRTATFVGYTLLILLVSELDGVASTQPGGASVALLTLTFAFQVGTITLLPAVSTGLDGAYIPDALGRARGRIVATSWTLGVLSIPFAVALLPSWLLLDPHSTRIETVDVGVACWSGAVTTLCSRRPSPLAASSTQAAKDCR